MKNDYLFPSSKKPTKLYEHIIFSPPTTSFFKGLCLEGEKKVCPCFSLFPCPLSLRNFQWLPSQGTLTPSLLIFSW